MMKVQRGEWVYVFSHSVVSGSFLALQTPLSMKFPRQEYWSWLPFPTPGYLSHPGIESVSLVSPALAGGFFTTGAQRSLLAQGLAHSRHLCLWNEQIHVGALQVP